jgi:hypothetical protein
MGKKRRILIAALLVVILGGFAWWLLRPSEPSYNGKSLSAWLEGYGPPYTGSHDADEAVHHIGTNAIPTLLRMLRASDSPLKAKCIDLLDRQHLVKITITPAWEKGFEAFSAFKALGPEAANAVPDLIGIYDAKICQDSQVMTAVSIGAIGPSAEPAIPSLLSGLKSTNDTIRWNTAWALGKIHGEPDLVVPELVKLFHDSDGMVRTSAAEAVGQFGSNAVAAVPDLIGMLDDGYERTRFMATNALKQIDPEAVAKAGIK